MLVIAGLLVLLRRGPQFQLLLAWAASLAGQIRAFSAFGDTLKTHVRI